MESRKQFPESEQLILPLGAPLYPVEIISSFLTIIAPKFLLMHVLLSRTVSDVYKRQRFKVLFSHNCTCRIIREWQNKQFGLIGDFGFKGVGSKLEVVLKFGFYSNRNASGQLDNRSVANKAWFYN